MENLGKVYIFGHWRRDRKGNWREARDSTTCLQLETWCFGFRASSIPPTPLFPKCQARLELSQILFLWQCDSNLFYTLNSTDKINWIPHSKKLHQLFLYCPKLHKLLDPLFYYGTGVLLPSTSLLLPWWFCV